MSQFPLHRSRLARPVKTPAGFLALSLVLSWLPVTADLVHPRIAAADPIGTITTVAGNGATSYSGDGGPAVQASFYFPYDVATGPAGDLFVADEYNNRVRRIDTRGVISTYAGNGTIGSSGDGGPATAASIAEPDAVVTDRFGDVLVTDAARQAVRKIDPAGTVTTVVGGNQHWDSAGDVNYCGDGGPATAACLTSITSLAFDAAGNLFIADDDSMGASRIRKVDTSGIITTVAGGNPNGSTADGVPATNAVIYGALWGVASDNAGNIYYSDATRVRKIDSAGIVTTVAGNGVQGFSGDGGPATSAMINHPTGVVVDGAGNIFFAEWDNNRVRRVNPQGEIATVVGNGTPGFSGDGGPATSATLRSPWGLDIDANGNLLIADVNNDRIRKVSGLAVPSPIGGGFGTTDTFGDSNLSMSCPGIQRCTGDPVNTATGNFWETFNDVSIPGRGPALNEARTYNSLGAATDSDFGYGWSSTYGMSLSLVNGTATITQENGGTVAFTQSVGTFTPVAPRIIASLVQNADGTYTFTRKHREIFNFDASGKLVSLKDLNGYVTTLSRPDPSTLVVTDPANRSLTFAYNGNHVTSMIDPIGRKVTYSYDSSGNLTDVIDVAGGHSVFTYDTSHRMTTMRSPKYYGDTTMSPFPVTTNHYDSSGRVDWQSDPLGRVTSFDYTSVAGSTKVTDPKGNAALYTYQYGEVMSETRAYGTSQAATWNYTYDPVTAALTSVTDPLGRVTQATYDSDGNQISATDALGRTSSATYDGLDDQTSSTDPLGITTTSTYDASGNPVTKDQPLTSVSPIEHEVTTYSYGDSSHPGDVTSVTDPLGHATTFAYNSSGDVISSTDAAGNKTTYAYKGPVSIGWLVSAVSPKGNVSAANPSQFTTTYSRDAFGRVTAVKDPLWSSSNPTAHQSTTTYDGNGNVVSQTDGDGHVTTSSYDPAGALLSTTRPDGTVLRNDYWADGSLKTQYDAANHATSYAYDALGNLISTTDPLGRVTSYGYDAVGNQITKTDPAGSCAASPGTACTRSSYDAANELTNIAYSDGVTPNVSYSYDLDGRRTQMTDGTGSTRYSYDSLSRLTSVTNGAGAAVSYRYDRASRQTQVTYPGNKAVARNYDYANRLTSVTDWLSHTTSFGYDADSDLTGISYPNGVTSMNTYDNADQLSAIKHAKGSTSLASFAYTYDAASLLSSANQVGVGSNETYGYDSVNRLTKVNTNTYGYDSSDNPTSLRGATQSFDAANELTKSVAGRTITTYAYNNRGDRTSAGNVSYSYDQANRLTSIKNTATYTYDGNGLRTSKTVGKTKSTFTWDTSTGLPLVLSDGTFSFIYGPNGLPIEQVGSSGTLTYLQSDQLGSIRLLTDSSGLTAGTYTYDAYGKTTATSGKTTTPLQYGGQYTDAETSLVYLRARYYDPATAQFLTRDPLVSATRSAYGYTGDSPLNGSDPSGLVWGLNNPIGSFVDAASGQVMGGWNSVIRIGAVGGGYVHDFLGAAANTATFGLLSNDDSVNTCSPAYQLGSWGAILIPGGGEEAGAVRVGRVLEGLASGRNAGVKVVQNEAELRSLYAEVSQGGNSVEWSGYKGSVVELPDGTQIGYRSASGSGGATIDVRLTDGTQQKVHVQ